MTGPIAIKPQLAPNPKQTPRYSVDVTLASGEKIPVADPTATRAMVALMDMQAQMGGAASHFGGPSAFAELMSALHGIVFHEAKKKNVQWYELFHILNDAGHCENGLYALKANYGFADLSLESLKGFRSINSVLTGHGESHLFPQGVYLSNGPLGSCVPQTQGLAFADKMSGSSRVTVTAISDGACMEGEAKEALAGIAGLAAKGKMNPYVLIISDNNTKLSGRIDEESFNMKPTFEGLKALGWHVIELKEGHDLQKCAQTIETALEAARKNPNKPVAIHAHTIKGFGTVKTVQSKSGGHGFPLSDPKELAGFLAELYGKNTMPPEFSAWCEELVQSGEKSKAKTATAPAKPKTEKIQIGVSNALVKMKKAGYPVVSISSDLPGSTGVAGFQKEFPAASQDVGVAESNMISMAAGLSKQGYIPVVDTFAQFGVTKGALPLTMAVLSQSPMICIFSHTGFQDAADGASHQATGYVAMTASIPHTDVYALTSSAEAEALITQAVENFAEKRKQGKMPHTSVFFLGRENFPPSYFNNDHDYRLGHADVVFDNTDKLAGAATIVAAGSLLPSALEAAYELEKAGVGVCVVNPSILNHPDVTTIATCLRNTGGKLITLEDHQLVGGMGSLLTHALALHKIPFTVESLGIKGEFGQSAYKASELYKKHGLDAASIVAAVKKFKK